MDDQVYLHLPQRGVYLHLPQRRLYLHLPQCGVYLPWEDWPGYGGGPAWELQLEGAAVMFPGEGRLCFDQLCRGGVYYRDLQYLLVGKAANWLDFRPASGS